MNPLNHTQAHHYLQAAADNWLEASERTALDEHLADCDACRLYAEQIGVIEGNLRKLFHKQWDPYNARNINLLPAVRVRYHKKLWRKQIFSYVNTLATIGLVVGLILMLNWFISTRQTGQPAGNLTPTPSIPAPTPARPTPTASATLPVQPAENLPVDGNPAGTLAIVSSAQELGDLYLINAGGNGQTKLFDDQRSLSLYPSWSPDGSKLAFVSTRDGNSEIYTIHASGTEPVRLTNNLAEDTDPCWSPDGKHIAFVSDRTGYREVYVMDTSGSNVIQLTHTQAANTHPTWSPEGAFIAFATNRDGYWQIYRMNADGSEPTNLSNNPTSDDREPAWSPDGQLIAFASQQVKLQVQEIYVMNADGSGRARLTVSASSQGQPASDYSPTWSPDSHWIAFWSYRDNPVYGDIYIIRVDNAVATPTTIIRLTTEGGSQPAWKP